MDRKCCGTCKWHEKQRGDYVCGNIFADECGYYTPYEHFCDEYEERGDSD